MALTDRERAIAGFAWSCGETGFSLQAMESLLDTAELLGGFDSDFIMRAAAGKCPSIDEIIKRLTDTGTALRGKKT